MMLDELEDIRSAVDSVQVRMTASIDRLTKLRRLILKELFVDECLGNLSFPGNYVELGEIVKFSSGYGFRTKDYAESGMAVLKAENIDSYGGIYQGQRYYIRSEKTSNHEKYQVESGDSLIVVAGSHRGRMAYIQHLGCPTAVHRSLWRIQPTDKNIASRYIYFMLSGVMPNMFERGITKKEELRSIKVQIVSRDMQNKIIELISSIDSRLEVERRQLVLLEKLLVIASD